MADCDEEYPRTVEGFIAMRKVPYTNWLHKSNEGEINESEDSNAEGESKATTG